MDSLCRIRGTIMDNSFDKMFYSEGNHIGGLDESGVSDIAGPLVAACVILPKIDLQKHNLKIFEVNDSKKIPEKYLKQHAAIIWEVAEAIGIGEVSASEIDYLGKQLSSSLAMLRAISSCRSLSGKKSLVKPDFLIVDGTRPVNVPIRQKCIRQGDTKSLCAAAASVVAKVYRNEVMQRLHDKFPWYDWINNKGYPCENQFKGLDKKGIQVGIHRIKSWPFIPNSRYPESRTLWKTRRYKWRKETEKVLTLTEERSLGL